MKVSIVILNWNRKQDTLECLKDVRLLNLKNLDLEIIVVDNGSTDGSVSDIKKQKIKNLVVLENKKNLGYSGGNNVGIKHALSRDANYILILNNDTWLPKNLLENLVNAAQNHPDAAIFSPKIYFAPGFEFHKKYKDKQKGKVLWYAGGEMDWQNLLGKNIGVDEVDIGQYDKIRKIDFATGACFLIRSEVLKKVGLFDEKYFLYMEDVDLSERIKKAGWKVIYIPTAYLWHKVSQSSGIGSNLNDYYIARNRLLFGFKFAAFRTKIALLKESLKILQNGRNWQKKGIIDFYLRRFGKGSFKG